MYCVIIAMINQVECAKCLPLKNNCVMFLIPEPVLKVLASNQISGLNRKVVLCVAGPRNESCEVLLKGDGPESAAWQERTIDHCHKQGAS